MNTSKKLATLLVTGALTFVAPAFAQSGSGSGSGSPGNSGSAPGQQPDRSMPPASTSTDTTIRTTTPDTSTTAGATTSGSANSANANTNANLNAGAGFYGPGASQFKNIDTDSDGRISRAEFTVSASNAASLTGSSTDTSSTSSATTSDATAKPEKKSWWSRRSDKAQGDSDPAETFTKLDTDNDGFLSQAELASANAQRNK